MPDNGHKTVNNNGASKLAWDASLGSWYFIDDGKITFFRGSTCFDIPLADAQLDASGCAPLAEVPDTLDSLGPVKAPFNRTFPCDAHAKSISYLATTTGSRKSTSLWINCVYGSWFYLSQQSNKVTFEISQASCSASK